MTGDERDLLQLVRQGVTSTSATLRTFWHQVQGIMLGQGPGPLTGARKRPLMRLFDSLLDRTFGLVQRAALTSDLFLTISHVTDLASETPFRRAIERLRGIVERREPALWSRIRGMAVSVHNDPFLRAMGMLGGSREDRQRVLRAAKLDGNRRWVDPQGYRLSDRVWKQGRDVRRQIDTTIQRAIRHGDDAATLANDLRRFLDPDVKGAHHAAYRLAKTEIAHAHGQGVIAAAKVIPGTIGVQWRLGPAHVKADACSDHASRDGYELGAGVYPANDVPSFPEHVLCKCRLVSVSIGERATMDKLTATYGGTA